MNLPLTKYSALVSHITRMTGINGNEAGEIVRELPDSDYNYLYALILNNKRDELKNYLRDYPRNAGSEATSTLA